MKNIYPILKEGCEVKKNSHYELCVTVNIGCNAIMRPI